jgi:hypothetical protein
MQQGTVNHGDATRRVALVISCAKPPPGPTLEIEAMGALPTGTPRRQPTLTSARWARGRAAIADLTTETHR